MPYASRFTSHASLLAPYFSFDYELFILGTLNNFAISWWIFCNFDYYMAKRKVTCAKPTKNIKLWHTKLIHLT